MLKHWFWFLLAAATIIWYSTITVYVAWKGVTDIRKMLGRLGELRDKQDRAQAPK